MRSPTRHGFCIVLSTSSTEIRAVPKIKTTAVQYHSTFISDCVQTVEKAHNLLSFKCTQPLLPVFLRSLGNKERLEKLRVNADVTTEQSDLLSKVRNLTSLALDSGSWNVADMLPKWAPNFTSTLTELILYVRLLTPSRVQCSGSNHVLIVLRIGIE